MKDDALERERIRSERTLLDASCDFISKYLAVWHLHHLVETRSRVITSGTLSTLEQMLHDSAITHQTQAYFMYKEIASTLCAVVTQSHQLADRALSTLNSLLGSTSGHAHRAVAEALGTLPFEVDRPKPVTEDKDVAPRVGWKQLCREADFRATEKLRFVGRSLVVGSRQENRLLVIKFAQRTDTHQALREEPQWMDYLRSQLDPFPMRFDIPTAIRIDGSYVFRLQDIPVGNLHDKDLHPERYAIGFIADEDYFNYPNGVRNGGCVPKKEFKEVMLRNSWLLGKLTGKGIVHSAPIPLFHNRFQRQRRRDHGLYQWRRAGRLDRWLESCAYPNLGFSGVRDFEHFIAFNGQRRHLYDYIGAHFLSLYLIVGSYFRNRDRTRIGLDSQGKPVDARDLFDQELFTEIIADIFKQYYDGFVGARFEEDLPLDLETLSERSIEEMGVDRHMDEILRVADQKEMTDAEFRIFLQKNRFSPHQIDASPRGVKDIVIQSGPHLGQFNHEISLPELVEAVATMSALCIVGKHRHTSIGPGAISDAQSAGRL
jgi:hypothetical protein